jgi:hypothetical protein
MATSSILFGNFADAGDSIIPTLAGSKMRGYMRLEGSNRSLQVMGQGG